MIWLQYDDPSADNEHEFLKHTYPDDEYLEALIHYEQLKKDWKRTRILFENDRNDRDWVIIQEDDRRG
jgi:hypothetical protein